MTEYPAELDMPITAEHILNGQPVDPSMCAGALAFTDALLAAGVDVEAEGNHVCVWGRASVYGGGGDSPLAEYVPVQQGCDELKEWQRAYDDDGEAEPRTFHLVRVA
jgi:hypothetical protein